MPRINPLLVTFALFALTGCGARVPPIADFPGGAGEEALLVQAIVQSIECDVSNAVADMVNEDIKNRERNGGRLSAEWLRHWGAQMTLTLSLKETGLVSPSAVGLPPSPAAAVFSIAGGASLSSVATRTETLNYFYTVKELYTRGGCVPGAQPKKGWPSPLIQDDLGLRSWLFDQLTPGGTQVVSYPTKAGKPDVLSHSLSFTIDTSVGVTPIWRLTRANINPAGTFFSQDRSRQSSILITFGPLDKSQQNQVLVPSAEGLHAAQQFAIANASQRN